MEKNKAQETETPEVTRTISKTEEVWDPDETDESTGEKRGSMLSFEEKLGTVELELARPLQLSDREEPVASLHVSAPTGEDIEQSKGNIRSLMRKCVSGINPRDLGRMHGLDYIKLQGLLRHFLSSI